MGGRAPYGFIKVKTTVEGQKTYTFETDNEQLPNLIKMYELYAYNDMSLGKVSKYLNNKNMPAAEGGNWDSCKISRILRNPVYVKADADIYQHYKNKGCIMTNDINDFIGSNGAYLYGKREANERKYTNVDNHTVSLGLHEGVIDSRTFLLCQYKLDSNRQIKNDGKGKHTWLSGYAKCGYCGYAVSVVRSGGGDIKYLNCRGKTNLKICDGHSVPILVSEVEKAVEQHLLQKVEGLEDIELEIKQSAKQTNDLKLKVLEIDNQIENLINQIAESNEIVTRYINNKITSLDNTKNKLLEEIKRTTIETSKTQPIQNMLNKIENWGNLDLQTKKQICGFFIKKVLIKPAFRK